jgi:putative ABC transport system permease protein
VLRVAWRSLRAHKSRLILSTFAVVLGVAFVGGSLIFSDTLKSTFTELFAQTSADVVVTPVGEVSGSGEDASVTLPTTLVTTISEVPGVEKAIGGVFVQGVVVIGSDGEPAGNPQAPSFGVDWGDDPDLSPLSLAEGRGPTTSTEIAIDTETAERGDLAVGDRVRILTPGPAVEQDIVGIFKFGSTGSLAGASLAAFDPATAQRLLTAPGQVTQIDVAAEEGVSQEVLAERITAVVPPGTTKVQTGAAAADEQAAEINEALSFIDYLILAFAGIALLVGIFLIVNTFSMLVAQRARELALLRALGASRRQVSRSLLVEALVVGIIGSTIGFFLGLLLAVGLQALLNASGAGLPDGGLVVTTTTVLWCYAVGIIVTLISAWFPARRASRVPPIAAMRETVTIPARSVRIRASIGAVLTVLGLLALVSGVSSDSAGSGAGLVGLGALLTLLGVAVVAPVLVRPLVAVIGWPVRRISPLAGRLAVDNAGRNRARTAGTASAIMIGLAVVSTFTILGSSVAASVDESIDTTIGADYIVQPTNFANGGFSPEVSEALSAVPGVESVASFGFVPARVDGDRVDLISITPATADGAVIVDFVEGNWSAVSPTTIAVDTDTAEREGLAIGDSVEVTFAQESRTLEVAATYESQGGTGVSGYVIDKQTATAAGVPDSDFGLYVTLAPGADVEQVRPALDAAVAPFPNVTLQDQQELKQTTRDQINNLLSLIYALLFLSILIAILGIVNTLALSVIERTREIGLLRAVGMSRTQVKRMIRWESVIIAIIGAILGIVLGVLFGSALQQVLETQGLLTLSIPTGQLVFFVVVAAIVGVLAAWRPARRAARLDVLKAISTE